jgi:hypothetical protein
MSKKVVLLCGLALVACGDENSPYRGTTDERRISRNSDRGAKVYARPVPGGCLYQSEKSNGLALAFVPFECPPDVARWNRRPMETTNVE